MIGVAKIGFKNKLYGDYVRECCSLQIAALKRLRKSIPLDNGEGKNEYL